MKRSSVSPGARTKSKSLNKSASVGLVDFLNAKFPNKVPIAAITAATKMLGRGRPLQREDRIVKRLAGNAPDIATSALVDLLGSSDLHEKGKPLSDEGVRRVYQNFANSDGKLTFEFIMKMGETTGVTVNERVAKRIIRKYGKKDALTA